jgi:hypothetical protein
MVVDSLWATVCTKDGFRNGAFDSLSTSSPAPLLSTNLPRRLLDICLTSSAIFVAPDYRLLPEATVGEVLEDVGDFWHWVHEELPRLTEDWNAHPDLERIACTGQSAGGYLAVQSALLFPKLAKIKVVASMGGSLNTNIPQCRVPGPRIILGKRPPPPGKAESIIRAYVRAIKPQSVRTTGDVVEMWSFLTCVLQQAYLARWLTVGGNKELDVMHLLENAKSMPPSRFSSEVQLKSRFLLT